MNVDCATRDLSYHPGKLLKRTEGRLLTAADESVLINTLTTIDYRIVANLEAGHKLLVGNIPFGTARLEIPESDSWRAENLKTLAGENIE